MRVCHVQTIVITRQRTSCSITVTALNIAVKSDPTTQTLTMVDIGSMFRMAAIMIDAGTAILLSTLPLCFATMHIKMYIYIYMCTQVQLPQEGTERVCHRCTGLKLHVSTDYSHPSCEFVKKITVIAHTKTSPLSSEALTNTRTELHALVRHASAGPS